MENIDKTFFEDYSLELLNETVVIFSCHHSLRFNILGHLIPFLYEDSFLSFTQHGEEISIFISSKHKDLFNKIPTVIKMFNENNDLQEYNVLKLYQINHQISELGIVSQFSNAFKEMEIPIIYVNSFSNNFILIPKEELHKLEGLIEF
jgi:hypothetical protein